MLTIKNYDFMRLNNIALLFIFIFWGQGLLYSNNIGVDTNVVDSVVIESDDEVLFALDHMARIPYIEMNELDTNRECLNIYGYAADSIPSFDSAYYAHFLDSMDQRTPFDLVYNKRTAAFIRLYANKRRRQTSKLLGLQHYYFPMMEEMLAKYEMPLELKYLSIIESGLNPKARSHAGAVGLWQFMYATGKMHGLHQNSYMDERMDPIKSTDAACRYLKYLYKMYHKWDLALAAYNCGPGNVNKAMRRSGSRDGNYWDLYPYLPRETRGYVPAFIAVAYVMNNASAHNIYPLMPKSTYYEMDTVHVKKALSFEQIAANLDMDVDDISYFNPTYKLNHIPAYSNKTSILYLPHEKASLFVSKEDSIYAKSVKPKSNKGKKIEKFSEERVVYTVRSGDYLGKVANKYNVTVSSIKKWNGLKNNSLRIGQRLVIYVRGSQKAVVKTKTSLPKKTIPNDAKLTYYEIQSGDTLWDIAKAKGVSIEEIKSWNTGLSHNNLKVGAKIIVKVA